MPGDVYGPGGTDLGPAVPDPGMGGPANFGSSITSPQAQNSGLGQVAGVIGSAIPVIGQAVSGAENRAATLKANQDNLDYAKWALQQSQQYSVQNWQMQADYNTPAQQMQRLRDAGLNPNLVYGSGSVSGNVAQLPSPPQVQQYHETPLSYQDSSGAALSGLSALMSARLNAAQTDNLQALTTKVAAEAALIGAQTAGQQATTAATYAGIDKTTAETSNVEQDTLLKGSQMSNVDEDTILKRAQAINQEAETRKTNTMLSPMVANLNQDTVLKRIQGEFQLNQKELNGLLAANTIQEGEQNILNAISSRANLQPLQQQQLAAMVDNLRYDAQLKDFDAKLNAAKINPQSAGWYYVLFDVLNKLGLDRIIPGILGGFIGGKLGGGAGAAAGAAGASQPPQSNKPVGRPYTSPGAGLSPNYDF